MDSIKFRESREIPSPVFMELLEQFYKDDEFQSEEIAMKLGRLSVADSQPGIVNSDLAKAEEAGPSSNCNKKTGDEENTQVNFSEVQEVQFLLEDIEDCEISKNNRCEKLFLKNKEREDFEAHEKKSVRFLLPFNISSFPSAQDNKKKRLPLTPYNVTKPHKNFESKDSVAKEYSALNGQNSEGITPNANGADDEGCETTFEFAKKAFDAYMSSEESGTNWLPIKIATRRKSEGLLANQEPPKSENDSASEVEIKCCCFTL